MIHATRLFHSLLHFRWILLPPPFIRKQLKMPSRGGSSSCSAQFYLYHKFYYGAFYKLVIQLNAFPMKQTTTKMDYARNCEFSWNVGFEIFRIINQSMFQNQPIQWYAFIQCCQLYHNFFTVGNTAFTLIRKEHHHPLLPPQRICSGATLWRQIMTVSSGRDFDQSKASFLRLSCQIGWAKSIFHLDCWL